MCTKAFVYFRRDPAQPNCDLPFMEAVMNECDIPYLLRRVRAHRSQAAAATCPEARLIHRRFVENYQHLLVGIRRDQLRERGVRRSPPCPEGACPCVERDSETARSRCAAFATAAAGEHGENETVPAIRYMPTSELVDHDLTAVGRQSILEAPHLFSSNVPVASAATAARQRISHSDRPAQVMAMDATA